ncbi:hypothetical protein [Bradyrhizobium sp. i1.15.2]|uniref:hypothetical protein n=1 Tax=Bradyrhizobium sp. i1.15.2 TaxID=3156362 RepID=UPI003395D32C
MWYPRHYATHPLNQPGHRIVPQDQEKTHVWVLEITGKVGGATAKHQLARGKQVRAVRNRERDTAATATMPDTARPVLDMVTLLRHLFESA